MKCLERDRYLEELSEAVVTSRRLWRALPIMGREMDSRNLEAASTFYPCMQVADIFELQLDVASAGMDQRKAHVLARDVAEKLRWRKPTYLRVVYS